MTWLSFDLFKFGGDIFQESLKGLVREAYLAAYSVLEGAHCEAKDKLYGELNHATDDDQDEYGELTSQVINHEESRWMEQRAALAAMALALLASLNKSFLDTQKRMLDKTHPVRKRYPKDNLFRQIAEY